MKRNIVVFAIFLCCALTSSAAMKVANDGQVVGVTDSDFLNYDPYVLNDTGAFLLDLSEPPRFGEEGRPVIWAHFKSSLVKTSGAEWKYAAPAVLHDNMNFYGTWFFSDGSVIGSASASPAFAIGCKKDSEQEFAGALVVSNSSVCVDSIENLGLSTSPTLGSMRVAGEEYSRGKLVIEKDGVVTGYLHVARGNFSRGTLMQKAGMLTTYSPGSGSYKQSALAYGVNSHGSVILQDGLFSVLGSYVVGFYGYATFVQRGGTFETDRHPGASADQTPDLTIGRGKHADYYISGGVSRVRGYLLMNWEEGCNGSATLTVDGHDAKMIISGEIYAANTKTSMPAQQINLNDGILETKYIRYKYTKAQYGGTLPKFYVNFNGGTIKSLLGVPLFKNGNDAVTRVTCFAGGATIDSGSSQWPATGTAIEGPSGMGVSSIPLPEDVTISGLGVQPVVRIEGDGEGASAIALYDADTDTVTGFKITCPGWDYTRAEAKVYVGGKTTEAPMLRHTIECVCTPNVNSGSLTKIGSGKLTLDAVNTYGGATVLKEGVLACGVDGAIPSSSTIILAGGVLEMNGKLTGDGDPRPRKWAVDLAIAANVTYNGDLVFDEGSSFTVMNADLAEEKVKLLTVEGSVTGTPTLLCDRTVDPDQWRVSRSGNTFYLKRRRGFAVLFK